MNIGDYLAKTYQVPPCWALVADVYATELGQSVQEYKTVSTSVRQIASLFRLELHKGAHGFAQLADPVDYAVVLLGKSREVGLHHAGIYYQGKVLHARGTEVFEGVFYQDVFSLRDEYALMEYWGK